MGDFSYIGAPSSILVIHHFEEAKLQLLFDEESEQGGEEFSHCCKVRVEYARKNS